MKLLLQVEDHFVIEGRGLVLLPLLDVPVRGCDSLPFSADVLIRRADGTEEYFTMRFAIEHFTLHGGGSRWGICPHLPTATKESVPKGSLIFVSPDTKRILLGESEHHSGG